jgi:hypothetical protein
MYPLTTTTRRLMAHHPCKEGIARLAAHLGTTEPNDQPIGYDVLLDALDLDDALWCCRAEPQHDRIWRRHVVWCARQVQHLMTDERSLSALDVAERHANGEATDEQLAAARAAAGAAARAAEWDAAWAAAWAAARDAAGDAARAAAWYAAWDAARAAMRDRQAAAFRQLVTTGTLPD